MRNPLSILSALAMLTIVDYAQVEPPFVTLPPPL
jgi:hypothetical protein